MSLAFWRRTRISRAHRLFESHTFKTRHSTHETQLPTRLLYTFTYPLQTILHHRQLPQQFTAAKIKDSYHHSRLYNCTPLCLPAFCDEALWVSAGASRWFSVAITFVFELLHLPYSTLFIQLTHSTILSFRKGTLNPTIHSLRTTRLHTLVIILLNCLLTANSFTQGLQQLFTTTTPHVPQPFGKSLERFQ